MRKALGVFLVAAAVAVAGLSAQGPTDKPATIIIIGCLQRSGQNAFTIKELRSGRNYQIVADAESIGWHVGHELEIHGSLEVTGDALRVKPDQVIFVADRCVAAEPSGR